MSKGNPDPVGRLAAYAAQASRRPPKEAVKEALEKSAGIIAQAAPKLGISQGTLRTMLREDPELVAYQRELKEVWKDIAESALLKNIQKGRSEDIRFFLRCFGADRGYVEVNRIAGADGGALKVEHAPMNILEGWELALLTDEEVCELRGLVPLAQKLELTNEQNQRLQELKKKACPQTIEVAASQLALPRE